jgi:hypothetical protein
MLGLVRTITFPFSSIGSLYMLYCTLIRCKLEYASVVWNSVTTTDANKLERIQQKFAALCYNRPPLPKSISLIPMLLSTLNSILYVREEITSMLFSLFKFTLVLNSARLYWKLLAFMSLLGTSRDFPLFYVCPTIKNCPSARCASAANVVCRDFDIFRRHNVSLEHILL